jgi:ribosomal protein S27AE
MKEQKKRGPRKKYKQKTKIIKCIVCEIDGEGQDSKVAVIPFLHYDCKDIRAYQLSRAKKTGKPIVNAATSLTKCIYCGVIITKDQKGSCDLCKEKQVEIKERSCMKCGEMFLSQHKFNRRCPKCISECDKLEKVYKFETGPVKSLLWG